MGMRKRKTWQEKLRDSKDLPKVVTLNANVQKHWKGKTMAIPSPMEINDIMTNIPEGKLITMEEIRKIIASRYGADIGCPLTSGIFSWIVAHAAVEEASGGKEIRIPYWRTLKSKGELNPKYPGGIELQKGHLESEGHKVIQKGKKFIVENYTRHLAKT
jgi:alkylated DNA nucleotide flippase Atl1